MNRSFAPRYASLVEIFLVLICLRISPDSLVEQVVNPNRLCAAQLKPAKNHPSALKMQGPAPRAHPCKTCTTPLWKHMNSAQCLWLLSLKLSSPYSDGRLRGWCASQPEDRAGC